MGLERKIFGVLLAALGFVLSPLSWWNDLFVNIPIAYAFAFISSIISSSLFVPVFLITYLLTNVVGLLLMQHSASEFSKKIPKLSIIENAAVSVFYMIIIISLMLLDIVPIPKQT